MNRIALDDHFREIGLFRSRVLAAVIFFTLLIGVLVSRLVWLQVSQHEHFTTLAEDNRVKISAIPPTRGLIFDRNGVVLADNLPSYALELTPEQIDDIDETLATLGEIINISALDIKRFKRLKHRKRSFQGVPLRFRLSDEEVARLAVNRHRLPGVEIAARLTRYYPQGTNTAHVIGYVGRINERELGRIDQADYSGTSHIGKIGVEKSFEDILHGSVGYRQTEVNAVGRVIRVLGVTPPDPGLNLHLTIDARLHRVANEAFGDRSGSVVAIDPNNGEVLTMISKPTYDPNLFVNGISHKAYSELNNDAERPLFNRILRGQYPPGSTVKPFYALAGIHSRVTTAKHRIFCSGFYQLPNDEHKYRDWKKRGHGWTDLNKSMVQSCDVYYYELAVKLGIDRMHDFMDLFGFGRRTGIDIRGELSGLMPSRSWKRGARSQAWFPGETVITGIGQGFTLVTPLQLASATATLSKRGEGYQPHVISAQENPITGDIEIVDPTPLASVTGIDPKHWDTTLESMYNVVNSPWGTARKIAIGANYKIAGKTGTAQVFTVAQDEEYKEQGLSRKLRDHALFMSYAPYEDPQMAVSVVVEHGGHGGSAAAPVARKLYDAYLDTGPAPEASPAISDIDDEAAQ